MASHKSKQLLLHWTLLSAHALLQPRSLVVDVAEPKGLYANIQAKRKRIAAGSGERMRKPGSKGAPTAQAFKDAAKTAKKKK